MLKLNRVKVNYGNVTALALNSELVIDTNDTVGVIGSNGSGKSTLIKALTNQVSFQGTIEKPAKIAVHLQENSYPNTVNCLTIMEGLLQTSYKKDEKLKELVHFFDFEKNLSKKFAQLSGGQKQRLTIIMVLYQDAELTCFDELSTGLDFETRYHLMQKIKAWYANKPAMVLIITHYFDELEQLANKLLIIEKGQLVAYDTTVALFEKHVGYSAILIETEVINMSLPDSARFIIGEKKQTAIACDDVETQQAIISELNQHGLPFSVTRNSVTLIYLNALAAVSAERIGE